MPMVGMRRFFSIKSERMCMPEGESRAKNPRPYKDTEVRIMGIATQGMTWKETFVNLMNDFIAWGCPYSRKKLPEIAMGYDCTQLFFWNWMDDPETPRTEKGFLRVLGYAWRKHLEQETETARQPAATAVKAVPCSRKAA